MKFNLVLMAVLFFTLSPRSLLLANEKPEALVIILGGNQSCVKTEALDPLPVPTIQEIAAQAHKTFGSESDKVAYIYSCYSGMHLDLDTIEFQYAPDADFSFRNRLFLSFNNFNSDQVLHQFFEYVADRSENLGNPDIFLVGHSYGGWTATRLAAHLIAKNKKVRGLELIDPISPLLCPAPEMAKYIVLTSAVLNTESLSGCRRGPGEIPSSVASALSSKGWWHNTYQTSFPYLHSSAMYSSVDLAERGASHEYRFGNNGLIPTDFHSLMGTHAGVWQGIGSRYRRFVD